MSKCMSWQLVTSIVHRTSSNTGAPFTRKSTELMILAVIRLVVCRRQTLIEEVQIARDFDGGVDLVTALRITPCRCSKLTRQKMQLLQNARRCQNRIERWPRRRRNLSPMCCSKRRRTSSTDLSAAALRTETSALRYTYLSATACIARLPPWI